MLDSLLSAAGKVGDWFANRENARHSNNMTKDLAQQNMALQREFAQSGIQWRVEDAKKAGIHPIYALGSAGASFSPVSANFTTPASAGELSGVGQDIGRAIHSTSTESQRQNAFTRASQALALERGQLENEVLRQQLSSQNARLRSPGSPPMAAAADPYMLPGQTQSGLTTSEPLKVTPAPKNAPHSEGGAIVDVGWARTPTGWVPVPSKDVKERIEDNLPHELAHFYRNNIIPMVDSSNPPPFKPAAGKRWVYHSGRLEWRQEDDPMLKAQEYYDRFRSGIRDFGRRLMTRGGFR